MLPLALAHNLALAHILADWDLDIHPVAVAGDTPDIPDPRSDTVVLHTPAAVAVPHTHPAADIHIQAVLVPRVVEEHHSTPADPVGSTLRRRRIVRLLVRAGNRLLGVARRNLDCVRGRRRRVRAVGSRCFVGVGRRVGAGRSSFGVGVWGRGYCRGRTLLVVV